MTQNQSQNDVRQDYRRSLALEKLKQEGDASDKAIAALIDRLDEKMDERNFRDSFDAYKERKLSEGKRPVVFNLKESHYKELESKADELDLEASEMLQIIYENNMAEFKDTIKDVVLKLFVERKISEEKASEYLSDDEIRKVKKKVV